MSVPWTIRGPVRRARNAAARGVLTLRQASRWIAIARTRPRRGEVAVSYGGEAMPEPGDVVFGGAVKFQLLHRAFPNAPRDFNVLYLGSSSMPLEARTLVRLAQMRGAAFVWNQNGVAYRGWYGDGWQLVNAPRARLLREADHVVYQSAFCKLGSDRFYGPPRGEWEILHNPVDTAAFVPEPSRPGRPLTLLLGGNQYQRYRIERALETLSLVRREISGARLIVAGALSFASDGREETLRIVERLGLADAVELTGPYSQQDAPSLMRSADLLLHTKYNDPCPTIVLEAMACGLPVVYSASGGTPELVGDEAGFGIEAPLDWERDHPPAPERMAEAVVSLAGELGERGATARERALRFDVVPWVERHRAIFENLSHEVPGPANGRPAAPERGR
jgi:glycosyltransferase involved in cell wall biosynthesis